MHKVLLTWYGITDLRASMGFEYQGPVLGALASGRFDSAVILAYTKKTSFTNEEEKQQQDSIDFFRGNSADLSKISKDESWHYVDVLANTPNGHQFYIDWLSGELNKRNVNVEISMQECFLKELNDTEGIYFSAVNALKETEETDEVTFFLSPGTPVMAFSWALALLSAPSRNITLLASSDFRKGIQTIDLPESVKEKLIETVGRSHA